MAAPAIRIHLTQVRSACNSCSLKELCLPAGLGQDELERLDSLINRNRKLKRGDYLYRVGGPLRSLYAVRTGFLKSSMLHDDGREQVTGFHLMGDLLGMDAIGTGRHMCDAVALEDSDACEIPFSDLEDLSRDVPGLQRHFNRLMSREIVREHGVMLLLGSMSAEERLAAFLLNLSQRYSACGYSDTRLNLRMTRQEIGSYLGLKLETISRTLSRMQNTDLIGVESKSIELKDPKRLRELIGKHANR